MSMLHANFSFSDPRKTIILPVVLYGCETWSLTLREECKVRVFKYDLFFKGGSESSNLTNSMAYGTRRFNAAFTRVLQ